MLLYIVILFFVIFILFFCILGIKIREPINVLEGRDNMNVDAFGRMRFSQPHLIFDSKQTSDHEPLKWDMSLVSGSGIIHTHNKDRGSSIFTTTENTAGRYIRQTFRHFDYSPGKSQFIPMTCNILKETQPNADLKGIKISYGQFDDNNGLFFRYSENTMNCVVRSSVSGSAKDTVIPQKEWNIDKMNGKGPSRVKVDWSKIQILIIDYGWLGADRVRFCMMNKGKIYVVHEYYCSNFLSNVYMSRPNNPLRFEVETTNESPRIETEQICCAVFSEAGQADEAGILRTLPTGSITTGSTVGTKYLLLSLRIESANNFKTIVLKAANFMLTSASDDVRWEIVYNPTYSTSLTYTSLENSAVEYSIGDGAITASGNIVTLVGYAGTGNNNNSVSSGNLSSIGRDLLNLGNYIDGTPTTIALCCIPLTGASDVNGSLTFKEF